MIGASVLAQPLRIRLILARLLKLLRSNVSSLSQLSASRKEKGSGELTVIDSRTDRQYHIPINNNAVQATDIGAIFVGGEYDIAQRMSNGLKILDPGFSNTAVMKSRITFV